MAKIVKKVKRCGGRPDMWNAGAFIQSSVSNKLYPQSNRIVIHTYKANITLIKIRLIKVAMIGKVYSLSLHVSTQLQCEIMIFIKLFTF